MTRFEVQLDAIEFYDVVNSDIYFHNVVLSVFKWLNLFKNRTNRVRKNRPAVDDCEAKTNPLEKRITAKPGTFISHFLFQKDGR
tara:strand:- start:2513 stop:2764 length:252 start_codon:yes stop_codon:yes gene_type:complete